MPLPLALRYASTVASTLRELHFDGRPHGWVNPAAVVLTDDRAELKAGHASRQATLQGDIAAFGALLFELVNGRKTGPDLPLPVVPRTVPRTGIDGLKMAANRLASRCLSPDAPDMQKVVTEVRLLKVLSRHLLAQEHAVVLRVPPPEPPPPEIEAATEEARSAMPQAEDEGPKERVNDHVAPDGSICPRCGSAYVYASKPRSRFEGFLRTIGSPVCRCHRCYHRFYMVLGIEFAKTPPAENAQTRD